jgi:hypothetical protein
MSIFPAYILSSVDNESEKKWAVKQEIEKRNANCRAQKKLGDVISKLVPGLISSTLIFVI